jgi:alpha-L-fucosidase
MYIEHAITSRYQFFWDYWKDSTNIRQNVVDFIKENYPPSFTYPDFAADFTAEFYHPEEWSDIFKASGAK